MIIDAVVIGRNEGDRLIAGLRAMQTQLRRVIYVDSGSSDGSVEAAAEMGCDVVHLDLSQPFTAARARNEGFARAMAHDPAPDLIQFMDGDCALREGWLDEATAFMSAHPEVAVTCGRRRERHPENSVYNRLIDKEWDTAPGQAKACGGDALMRAEALAQVGGYNPSLIAGEEPEMCVRLRQAGWQIWRLDAEMTWHDAALTRLGQWWTRARRAGHAYAEGAALHGAPPERHAVAETRRALIWGAGVPLLALLGLVITPWALAILLAWPAQIIRLGLRSGDWQEAFFMVLGKLPEAQGVLQFWRGRLSGKRAGLIEYK